MRSAANAIVPVTRKLGSAFFGTGLYAVGAMAIMAGSASAQGLDAVQIAAIQGQVNSSISMVDAGAFNASQFDPAALCNCVETAPPPAVRTFILFFDFDEASLTVQAQQVVTEAVAEVERNGAARIQVVGHTDTAHAYPGTAVSQEYNQALSERRAVSVKAEMVRQGIAADEIVTEGRSFNDLLVETGPGVREPQNRRAVIDLGDPTLRLASASVAGGEGTMCAAPELVQAIADLNILLVMTYGSEAASEIGSIILAAATAAGVPPVAIGAGLGRGAQLMGQTDAAAAMSTARLVANEGTGDIASSFAASVCMPMLASIALSPPETVAAAGDVPNIFGGNPVPDAVPVLAVSGS